MPLLAVEGATQSVSVTVFEMYASEPIRSHSLSSETTDDASLREFWTTLDHEKVMDHFVRLDTTAHGSTGPGPAAPPPTPSRASHRSSHRDLSHALPAPRRVPIELDISQVGIDISRSWPSRASLVPMHVLSLVESEPVFVSQIHVKANGVQMLALIDTGAGITVAARSILPLLGIFHLQPSRVPAAVGVAGIPVRFVGCAPSRSKIGSTSVHRPVHFTEGDSVPRSVDAYNIILGNDIPQSLSLGA
ncbi:unnamed protein product [Heligmosomoides polygyrus]|uniref:Peptidase A2 domain-containing protein n=1 Tax=Heligmosomoides polygyrus TaxID=6339 RepID=A0A183F529_HELPZ|nr:unnamed protein product [Heligmosomoides polygyrus]